MSREKRLQQKREYYQKNRERILEQMKQRQREKLSDPLARAEYCEKWRQYTRKNYEARLLSSIKSKCKRFNIAFDLELEDIVIPDVCPKTGIKLTVHTERGKHYDTPSIDRIDPKKGYTKDNIQVVSFWYNIAKLNWDEKVFLDMCRKVVEMNGPLLTS
jgi:hypothetical protein